MPRAPPGEQAALWDRWRSGRGVRPWAVLEAVPMYLIMPLTPSRAAAREQRWAESSARRGIGTIIVLDEHKRDHINSNQLFPRPFKGGEGPRASRQNPRHPVANATEQVKSWPCKPLIVLDLIGKEKRKKGRKTLKRRVGLRLSRCLGAFRPSPTCRFRKHRQLHLLRLLHC
jgi:hypothetical protein